MTFWTTKVKPHLQAFKNDHRPAPGSTAKSLRARKTNSLIISRAGGALGVLTVATMISALLGNVSTRASIPIAAILAFLTVLSFFIASKLNWQHRTELDRKLLLYYCDKLHERHNYTWTITSWRQLTIVEASGDTRERIEFTAVPNVEALDFLTFWEGPGWKWPQKHKKNTRLHVTSVQIGGGDESRFEVTSY